MAAERKIKLLLTAGKALGQMTKAAGGAVGVWGRGIPGNYAGYLFLLLIFENLCRRFGAECIVILAVYGYWPPRSLERVL